MHKLISCDIVAPFRVRRWLSAAAIGAAVLLGACGSGGSDAGASARSTASQTTTTLRSTRSPSSNSSSASDTGTPALVACELFDLPALDTATGLTWTAANQTDRNLCVISSDDGSAISVALSATKGQNDAALSGAKGVCDTGTLTVVDVVDGGYVCEISGTPSAGTLFKGDNVMVAASGITTNGSTNQIVERGLVDLLRSFVDPSSASAN